MLPAPALKLLMNYLRFCSWLHIFPFSFHWDKNSQRIYVKRGGLRKILYWIAEIGMLLYQILLLYRAKQVSTNPKLNDASKAKALYFLLSFAGMAYNRLVLVRHEDEVPALLWNFTHITNEFAGANKAEPTRDKVSRMIRLIIYPSAVLLSLNILVALRRPEAPHHLSSLFPNPKALPKGQRLICLLLQAYINCSQYLTAAFNLIVVTCYVEAILPMIHRMENCRAKAGCNDRPCLSETMRVRYYNQLRALQALFNSVYSYWALGAQAYFMIAMVVNNFQAVVFLSLRALFASGLLATLCCLIFKHLGHVKEASTQTLHSWKDTDNSILFNKFRRSLRPLRVRIASFYFADYSLVIIMMSVVLSNSGSLIVAWRDA